MKLVCPDCGRIFSIPNKDAWWLADAKRRNPPLKIICTACGKIEQDKLERKGGVGRW